jgi:hypothetical protein
VAFVMFVIFCHKTNGKDCRRKRDMMFFCCIHAKKVDYKKAIKTTKSLGKLA